MAAERDDSRTWPAFERLVAALQARVNPAAKVTQDERLIGKSGTRRQLDVVVRGTVGSAAIMVVLECKEYASRVGIELVEAFIAKLEDVDANQGIMVAKTGYTKDAVKRASTAGIITSVLRPARDEDWDGYLRSLHLRVVSRVIVHEDLELELVDGRRVATQPVTMLGGADGERMFLDRILDRWLHDNEWANDAPIALSLTPPLRLLRDPEEPGVAVVRCRPKWSDGFEVEAIIVRPEDWVVYRELPAGNADEKTFFESADLVRAAEAFVVRK